MTVPGGVVDLGIGQPQEAMLPVALIARALTMSVGAHESRPLQYGPERGDWGLITALARFLTEHYRFQVHSRQLLISNGNSQAIDLCCTAFTTPGDTVFVEEPSYFLALRIFADHGLKVVGVPVDDQGLRIDALEAELEKHSPRLIYTVPTGHNPTGSSLPPQRRRRLVELARAHGFLVLADEAYQLLDYTGSAPEPVAAQLESGVVVSLGTFSKILAPGLRVGWIHTCEHLLTALAGRGQLISGSGLNPLTGALIAPILADGGMGHYLATIRSILGARMTTMDEALRAGLPAAASYRRPDAGYFCPASPAVTSDVQAWSSPISAKKLVFAGDTASLSAAVASSLTAKLVISSPLDAGVTGHASPRRPPARASPAFRQVADSPPLDS